MSTTLSLAAENVVKLVTIITQGFADEDVKMHFKWGGDAGLWSVIAPYISQSTD